MLYFCPMILFVMAHMDLRQNSIPCSSGDAPDHGMVRCLRCMELWCLHYAGMVSWSLARFMVPGEHYCQGAITNCAGVSDMGPQ